MSDLKVLTMMFVIVDHFPSGLAKDEAQSMFLYGVNEQFNIDQTVLYIFFFTCIPTLINLRKARSMGIQISLDTHTLLCA